MNTSIHTEINSDTPLVSIIIPAYNAEDTIGECIESVQAQEMASFECLVIVDGATDQTANIANTYSKLDKRIKTIIQDNQGRSVARNNGIHHAAGQWIMFMDADDSLSTHSLKYLTGLNDINSYDIIYGNYIRSSGVSHKFSNKSGIIPIETAKFACLNLENMTNVNCDYSFDNYNCRTCWGKLYSKKLFSSNTEAFPIGVGIGEDTFMNYTLLNKATHIAFVDKPVYIYNDLSAGTVRTLNLNEFNSIITLAKYVQAKCISNPQDSSNLRAFLARDYLGIYSRMSRYSKLSQIPQVTRSAKKASTPFILNSLPLYLKVSNSPKGLYNWLRIQLPKWNKYILMSLLLKVGGLLK